MNDPVTQQLKSRRRFEGIDVLRGLAALTVVFSHYNPFWNRYLDEVTVVVNNRLGYYAVNLFFIISGFVIFLTLDKCRSVRDFALLRFSRLYPAYWATLAFATFTGVLVFGKSLWLGGFVVNATMFQEFLGYPHFDNVYWSLTVELAFYLNVAWLFAFGLHRKVLVCLTAWLAASALWAVTLFDPGVEQRDWFALLFALDYAAYFALGILTYNALGRAWLPAERALAVAALVVAWLVWSVEGLVVATVSFGLIVLAVRGGLDVLTNRVTLWFGAISYTLYLTHRNTGYEILPLLHGQGMHPLPAILITAAIVIAIAGLITRLVEIPASRWMRRRWWPK